ncbi:MAG: hypothetical protein NTZ94_16970, partial [Verrucomicrobia bacterium]|nr:hypothetical protein [Verrucomicrobiota bacterium]
EFGEFNTAQFEWIRLCHRGSPISFCSANTVSATVFANVIKIDQQKKHNISLNSIKNLDDVANAFFRIWSNP